MMHIWVHGFDILDPVIFVFIPVCMIRWLIEVPRGMHRGEKGWLRAHLSYILSFVIPNLIFCELTVKLVVVDCHCSSIAF